ncbi:MAG: AbrB/MazE/SpoVT family DNA-binding domain-containing protein [Thermoanaerobaculia bacterium]
MRSSRLTVERAGVITLPAEVREAVRLRPGDVLAIKPGEGFFDLEIYRELLDGAWECMGHSILMGFVIELLSRPLTALEPGGHVRIPAEVFPLPVGSELSLTYDPRGTSLPLHLYRVSAPTPGSSPA